ncbi:hypothetical protein IKQ38_04585 [Candidatus Saccharibacteria bacterium]|nr:hypothetical protein [Candidatus Saccharibacteria bacterium]
MKDEDKTFLYVFFGITPFCIFGIHDFIINKPKRAILHLVIFFLFFLCALVFPIIETLRDLGQPQAYGFISTIGDPETVFNNIGIFLMGLSYLLSIFEVITYMRTMREKQRLIVSPPEKPEDPFTHDEEF